MKSLNKSSKIYVAGGETLIGAAVLRQLTQQGYTNLVGVSPDEPDLINASQVEDFFAQTKPEYVFVAAGKSGGIAANQKYPADLMLDNLRVATHIIQAAHQYHVQKLLYLASSCSYPRETPQPMQTQAILTGPLEPTNEAYAVAKLAGIKLCQAYHQQYGANFISGIPANSFGPGDDFSPEDSHVIGALIHRMHQAKILNLDSVEVWGTGTPRREFIFVDDLADACIFIMREYNGSDLINIGGGTYLSIAELAALIKEIVGYSGNLSFDTSRPDGMPLKALDSSQLLDLGWRPRTAFHDALAATYRWYLQTQQENGALNV